jgi:D-alanine-D-alanine ligase
MNLDSLRGRQIAVLLGGTSPEREISLMSGATVLSALEALGADAVRVDTAEPRWWLQLQDCELAFISLHGAGGEDGVVQGALETLGVAYTGSGVLGSALAMDKLMSKRLWQGIGVATADFAELTAASDWQAIIDRLGSAFVKPASGGSSIGTAGAADATALLAAWQQAAQYGGKVMAERLIEGDEFTVAILDDLALPAIRLETDNEFYDYEAKYFSDATRYLCPCGLSQADEAQVSALALEAFNSLDCSGWGRVDFMRDHQGKFWVLEVNTVPGMTDHSLVPMAAAAAGINLEQLVGRIALLGMGEG